MLRLQKATIHDGNDIYCFLQKLPADENGFINSAAGKDFEEYKLWLQGVVTNAEQQGIVDGWKVPQSTYWLFGGNTPIGYGKVRHFLTDSLMESGGHVGIAIHPDYRGKGYGKAFLSLLKNECRQLGITKLLCTIKNHNKASIQMALACGGILTQVTDTRHYITIVL